MKRWVPAATGRTRPLLHAVMSARSFLQVRISYFGEAGGVPLARAMLYLTCVGKWGGYDTPKSRRRWGCVCVCVF